MDRDEENIFNAIHFNQPELPFANPGSTAIAFGLGKTDAIQKDIERYEGRLSNHPKGYTTIRDISSGSFSLHKEFWMPLWMSACCKKI